MKKYKVAGRELLIYDYGNTFIIKFSRELFLEIIPPCSKCLINTMCVEDLPFGFPYYDIDGYISVRICDKLRRFLNNLNEN